MTSGVHYSNTPSPYHFAEPATFNPHWMALTELKAARFSYHFAEPVTFDPHLKIVGRSPSFSLLFYIPQVQIEGDDRKLDFPQRQRQ